MMPYGIQLSTKHPSETNKNAENSYFKFIICLVKIFFYNVPIKIKILCRQNNIGPKYFADIRLGMF